MPHKEVRPRRYNLDPSSDLEIKSIRKNENRQKDHVRILALFLYLTDREILSARIYMLLFSYLLSSLIKAYCQNIGLFMLFSTTSHSVCTVVSPLSCPFIFFSFVCVHLSHRSPIFLSVSCISDRRN